MPDQRSRPGVQRLLTRLRASLVRLGFAAGRLRSVSKRVVLATTHADELSGNLAEIRRHLRDADPPLPFVVLARRVRPGWRGLIAAAVDALTAGWHLARAAVFVVDDHYFPMYAISPRAGTTRVQVWHACGAFKKFGYSVTDKAFGAGSDAIEAVPIHTNYDLCLVSAGKFAPFYAEAFGLPLSTFTARLGIPRTDLFFDPPRRTAAAAAVRRRYGIPDGRRVVLYAPTFRGERITEASSPQALDPAALRRGLGDDAIVLLRAHPFVATRYGAGESVDGSVVDVSDWPEINELMLVADALVTDYSSAIYEYALLGRPMAFFAPDRAEYERERGFYFDYETGVPGPVFESTHALAQWLARGEFDRSRVEAFRDASFDVADGRATARLIAEVIRPALR